jgi:hypothetical protein
MYSKYPCGQCSGKGYFDRDYILPNGQFTLIDGKNSRVTPKETRICECTEKKILKEIIRIEKEIQSATV